MSQDQYEFRRLMQSTIDGAHGASVGAQARASQPPMLPPPGAAAMDAGYKLLGIASLTYSASSSSWNWRMANWDASSGVFVPWSSGGSDDMGPCVVASGGAAGATGLIFVDLDAAGAANLVFVPFIPGQFWVKITGATLITANRWSYTWTEQQPGAAGLWVDKPSGRTSSSSGLGYNSMEANNAATGIQGSGDDLATFPSGTVLFPIRGNPVVEGTLLKDCDGVAFFSFAAVNKVNCGGS